MKLLLLTSNYPSDDLHQGITPVVHYYVKEWKKLGHDVLVIHNYVVYPIFFYRIFKLFNKQIANLVGSVVPKEKNEHLRIYERDGIKIVRIPIQKYFPHFRFLRKTQQKQFNKITEMLSKENFIPEFVLGHWISPQLYLCNRLKEKYQIKCSLVIHEVNPKVLFRDYKDVANELLLNIDFIGFRSLAAKKKFEDVFGVFSNSFLCYSGIPDNLTPQNINLEKFNNELKIYSFVGNLVRNKYPSSLIEAISNLGYDPSTRINYVGIGAQSSNILTIAKDKGMLDNIKLHGYIPRQDVTKILFETECFIMISKEEAFGLVYLEAMICGCITIASRDEGIDGVIIDGYNGFLCAPGDVIELHDILKKINKMSIKQRQQISINAWRTAANMTDTNVALKYLENIGI
jgi:glycosyltransferase involved in cell wall biosynthesis